MLLTDSFHRLPANARGRDLFVGDVHGERAMLEAGLAALRFDPAVDRLIGVGDLIDRGPDSAALLQLLADAPWFICTLGNHEALMRDALFGDLQAQRVWFLNGGGWIRHSPIAPLALQPILDGMPLALELQQPNGLRVGVVHAELPMGTRWSNVSAVTATRDEESEDGRLASALLWGRSRYLQYRRHVASLGRNGLRPEEVPDIDLVISGHNVLRAPREPVVWGNCLMIDTGAYEPEGRLTFVDLAQGSYLQVCKSPRGGKLSVLSARPIP